MGRPPACESPAPSDLAWNPSLGGDPLRPVGGTALPLPDRRRAACPLVPAPGVGLRPARPAVGPAPCATREEITAPVPTGNGSVTAAGTRWGRRNEQLMAQSERLRRRSRRWRVRVRCCHDAAAAARGYPTQRADSCIQSDICCPPNQSKFDLFCFHYPITFNPHCFCLFIQKGMCCYVFMIKNTHKLVSLS